MNMKRVAVRILALTSVTVFALLACDVPLLKAQGSQTQGPGPSKSLSLDEAKELALKTSVGIKLGELNASAQTEATEAQKKDYLPKVLADFTYVRLSTPLGEVLQAGPIGPVPVSPSDATATAAQKKAE
jgi:hypothetical protein